MDTEICGGVPTFNGTRITVWQVLELLKAGVPIDGIMNYYITPLTRKHINAALHYAKIIARGRDNVLIIPEERD